MQARTGPSTIAVNARNAPQCLRRRWWPALAPFLVLIAACGKGHPAPDAARREIVLAPSSGPALTGTVYRPLAPRPGGILLLGGPGTESAAWNPLAQRARDDDYMSMAVALPGPRQEAHAAIRAALEALVREGADAHRLGLVGAGTAANRALEFAATQPDAVDTLVIVSPRLEWDGVEAQPLLEALSALPVLFVSMAGDDYSAGSARELHRHKPGFSELREYAGSAHGADIFTVSESALEQVVYWFNLVLAPVDMAADGAP